MLAESPTSPPRLPPTSECTASQVHELSNWEPSNKPFLSGTEQFVTWWLACVLMHQILRAGDRNGSLLPIFLDL